MKHLFTIIYVLSGLTSFAQYGEEVGPLTGNPALQSKGLHNTASKINVGTFDSTFIYTSDTLEMPFFDEFSLNKFQLYFDDFGNPLVTFDKVYRLLDMLDVPVSTDSLYTGQQTFRKVWDEQTLVSTVIPFASTQIKIGDLSSYPVTHFQTSVFPPFYIFDTIQSTIGVDLNPDTIWIVGAEFFQDSATQFFDVLDDTSSYWLDDQAYHNYSMGKDPWSLGMVTFDGLDETGFPYAIGTTNVGYADHLTSKPIKMGSLNPSDSVYFSFMYQPQGHSDEPEEEDSLVLEFYEHDLGQWNRIWSSNGGPVVPFKLAHIPVTDLGYFNDGFQFRFKNYGGLSGSLDIFHLDYVNLRAEPLGLADTNLRDMAFSYPLYTLLNEFTSVPWDHYVNVPNHSDVMSEEVQVVMANSFPGLVNALPGMTRIYFNNIIEDSVILEAGLLADNPINYQANSIPYSMHDFKTHYAFDHLKPGISQEFEIRSEVIVPDQNEAINDSTKTMQKFENYYSYDDGSAELAYGTTGPQSRLAIQYTPYEADSVIGAMIHFVPSVVDVSNNLFLLTIWGDNNGVPGSVLYEDGLFFPRSPKYGYDQNIFTYYMLPDTAWQFVTGTFYIGWRQFETDRLNVGLDRNIIKNEHTFYSNNGGASWDQSAIEGSVMIRPIFSTGMDVTLGIEDHSFKLTEPNVSIYPNPTSSKVTIEMDQKFNGAEFLNMQGQVVLKSEFPTIDMNELPSGMYFIKIVGVNKLHKIIKN
jgi:hypothetical protein